LYRDRVNNIKNVTTHHIPESIVPIQVIVMDKFGQTKSQREKHNNIMISKESMNHCIKEDFDLDFCKIIFDGTNVIKYDNDALKNKICTFSISKK